MDDPAKKATGPKPAAAAQPAVDADEFAGIPRPRTRHPVLALGAGLLALFLVIKMRADLSYFLSSRSPADLGDARTLLASERGRGVLAEGVNRLVRVHGTPDRESALQVDTKGSWTFTQFFKILGTNGRLFVHRRQDPLPAALAEQDVFEGRLVRFSDLSFQDAIRGYFAGHVSATHFFAEADVARAVAAGVDNTVTLPDRTGDGVTLGPNDIVAIVLRHPGEVQVSVPVARFADPALAKSALVARGARVLRAETSMADRHLFVVAVAASDRDRILNAIGDIDARVGIQDVRETVKARLSDLSVVGKQLAVRGGATGDPGAGAGADAAGATARLLDNVDTIRTLAPVQVPADAYLIVEGETPREHLPEVAITLVLLVFASVNLVGLGKGLRP